MKNVLLFFAIAFGIGLFIGYGEITRYQKNIEIEKSPAYTLAVVTDVSPKDAYARKKDISYVVNYKFTHKGGTFSGKTNKVDYDQARSYKSRLALKVAYLESDPTINTPESYFRPGKTSPELREGLIISALIGIVCAIPVFFFIGFVMWVIRKIR